MFTFITTLFGSIVASAREMSARNAANDIFMPQHVPGAFPPSTEKPSARVYAKVRKARAELRAQRQHEAAEYRGTTYIGGAQCCEAQLRAMEDFQIGLNAGAFLAGHQQVDFPRLIHVFAHNAHLYPGLNADVYNHFISEGAGRHVQELLKACKNGAEAVNEVRTALAAQGLDTEGALMAWYTKRVEDIEQNAYEQVREEIRECLANSRARRDCNCKAKIMEAQNTALRHEEKCRKEVMEKKKELQEQCRSYEAAYVELAKQLRDEFEEKQKRSADDLKARKRAIKRAAFSQGYKRGKSDMKRKMGDRDAEEEQQRSKRARV